MRRAFTLIETIIAVIAIALLFGFILLTTSPSGHGRAAARQLKDSTQIRAIAQSLVVWTNSNDGTYPLPSRIDVSDLTVSQSGRAKDTSANIFSILIFNGNISPELCISPAESNTGAVQRDEDYEYNNPQGAGQPQNALWDPKFHGTPLTEGNASATNASSPANISNNSYAHVVYFGKRRAQWADTFSTTEAVFGNRGPQYTANDEGQYPQTTGRWTLLNGPTGTGSNTLLIHGGRSTWEGNIGYNDGHVGFETKPNPDGITYTRSGTATPRAVTDNLFVMETDEAGGTAGQAVGTTGNAFLRPLGTVSASGTNITITPWRD